MEFLRGYLYIINNNFYWIMNSWTGMVYYVASYGVHSSYNTRMYYIGLYNRSDMALLVRPVVNVKKSTIEK